MCAMAISLAGIKNLYFAAAGSHPGAGIPGVLSSAKVVENIIKAELKFMCPFSRFFFKKRYYFICTNGQLT